MNYTAAQVESVVTVFYSSDDSNERSSAHSWLLQLQASPAAWQVCWELMVPMKRLEVQYFGSCLLSLKMQKNYHDIPEESHSQLLENMIACVKKHSGHHLVAAKLLSAISCHLLYSIATNEQKDIKQLLDMFGKEFGNEVGKSSALFIQFLTILPEQFNHLSISGTQKGNIRCQLECCYSEIVHRTWCVISADNEEQNIALALKCLLSWAEFGLPLMECGGILPKLFSMLTDEELYEDTANVLVELITHPSSERAERTIYLFFHHLAATAPILQDCIHRDDQEKLNCLCKLFVNAGETHTRHIIGASMPEMQADSITVLKCILICTGLTGNFPIDETASELTFNFWFVLQDELLALETNSNALHLSVVKESFFSLLGVLLKKVRYPDDTVLAGYNTEENEQLRCYRQDIQDTAMHICCLLREKCLEYLTRQLMSLFEVNDRQWQDYDAVLYLLQGVAEYVALTEATCLPMIMLSLHRLPSHRRVAETAVYVVGSYAEWLKCNVEHLNNVLPLLLNGMKNEQHCLPCSIALKDVCRECASSLSEEVSMKIIETCLECITQTFVTEKTIVRFYEIIGYTMSPMPLLLVSGKISVTVAPIFNNFTSALQNSNDTKHALSKVKFCLDCVVGLLRTFDSIGADVNGRHPLVDVMEALMPVLSQISAWTSNHEIVDAVSACISKGIDVLQDQFMSLVVSTMMLMLHLLESSHCGSLLLPCATIVGMFDKEQQMIPSIQEFVYKVSVMSLGYLQTASARDSPDFVNAFMVFVTRVLKTAPTFLAKLPDIQASTINCAMSLLGCQETPTIKAACGLLLALINCSVLDEQLQNLLQSVGLTLVEKIMVCICGQAPRQTLDQFSDLLFALNRHAVSSLSNWLNSILFRDDFLNGVVSATQKQHFRQAVLRGKGTKRHVKEVVREFSLQCRGLQGTSYAQGNVTF